MKPSTKTFLLYARVSPKGSQWACEETSIAVQLADMRARVLSLCGNAQFIEVFDEFKSGKDLNRPGIQRILADLSQSPCPWQCLVVWNLDRLSRSLADAIPIFAKLRDANCEFISINQEYLSYTGAMARYMLHQTIAIAELERGMTSERVTAKLRWIASQGKVPFAIAPMGYVKNPEVKNTLLVDESKAEIVRTVFDLFVNGKLGYSEIKARFPGVFKNRQQLYRILRNPLYIGEIHYGDVVTQGDFPAIVEKSVFEQAQTLLSGFRRNYAKVNGKKYDYLLSGLVLCHCGRHMTPYSVKKGEKRFFYYKCTAPDCKNAVNAESLDAMVVDELVKNYTQESTIRTAVQTYLEDLETANAQRNCRRQELSKSLEAARKKENGIANMFLDGLVDQSNKGYWNAELASARAARESLEDELKKLSAPSVELDLDKLMPELLEAGAEWAKKIAAGEIESSIRRNLVMSAVQSCVCMAREDNSMTFQLNLVMNCSNIWRAGRDLIITSVFSLFCGYRARIRRGLIGLNG